MFITRTPLGAKETVLLQKSSLNSNGRGKMPSEVTNSEIYYPVTICSQNLFEQYIEKKCKIRFKLNQGLAAFKSKRESYFLYGYFCENLK